jgi:O-antigen/teichoic acid export membrane protein
LVFALILFVTNLALNFFLIPRWGILGTSIAKVTAIVAGSAYLFAHTHRLGIAAGGYPFSRLIFFLILFSLLLWSTSDLGILVVTVLSLFAFIVLVYLLRVYNSGEIKRFKLAVSGTP